jgi:hypothetical protein
MRRPDAQLRQRGRHHDADQRERAGHGSGGGQAAQAYGCQSPAARRILRERGPPPGEALEHQQGEGDRHEQGAQLKGGVAVEGSEPDLVDRVGEGLQPQQIDRPEVGQGLHQR